MSHDSSFPGLLSEVKGAYPWPDKPSFVPAMAAYHARMRAKSERAAARPWLPVDPDLLK